MERAKKTPPSIDAWLAEAKKDPAADRVGMFLVHNGVVRRTPKALVRQGRDENTRVEAIDFSYDGEKVQGAIDRVKAMDGIFYVRVWLNEGRLPVGEDIMLVLIGGDIRPHVVEALQSLVGEIKQECVTETEVASPGV